MTHIKHLLHTYRLPLLLLAALVPTLFAVIDYGYSCNNGSMGTSAYYFVGYETGFGGRKLLGTLYGLLLPDFVRSTHLRPFIIGINMLMLFLFAGFAIQTLRRLQDDRLAVPQMAVYLATPFSILGWVHSTMSLYFTETYTLALTLAWLMLYVACPRRWWYYLLTAAIAITACLIHHTFCCTFFPLMAALMLHDSMPEGRIDWRRALPYGLICAALAVLLGAIWMFSHMNIDYETLHQSVLDRTTEDAYGRGSLMYDYFYKSNSENSRLGFITWEKRLPMEFALTLLMLLPALAVLAWPWVAAARTAPQLKWRYWGVLAADVLMTLPMFVMATDYGRWWTALCFTLFALPLAAAARGDQPLREALAAMYGFFRRHLLLAVVLIVYLLQLAPHPQFPYFGMQQAMRLRELMGF